MPSTGNIEVAEQQQQDRIPQRPFGGSLYENNDRLPPTVSIVGLGCSSFSTFFMNRDEINCTNNELLTMDQLLDPNHPTVQSWIDTIEYAITVAGITILDTAPWYGHGTSELVIGYAMMKLCDEQHLFQRQTLMINTKIGRYEADPTRQFDYSYTATMNSVQRSIQRLCCGSYIDVLQLHDPEFAPSIDLLFQETIPAMMECQTRGWCRALGITGTYYYLLCVGGVNFCNVTTRNIINSHFPFLLQFKKQVIHYQCNVKYWNVHSKNMEEIYGTNRLPMVITTYTMLVYSIMIMIIKAITIIMHHSWTIASSSARYRSWLLLHCPWDY